MSCDSLYDGGVTYEDGSRLFCTPPPEETLAELDCWTGEEKFPEGTEELGASATPEPPDCGLQFSSSKQDGHNRLDCSPQDEALEKTKKRFLQTQNRQPQNKFFVQLSRCAGMAAAGRSLTSSTTPSKGNVIPSANHPARGESSHSHLATSTSLTSEDDSAISFLSKQPQESLSLGPLVGYTSTEEEVETLPNKKEVKPSARSSATSKIRKKNTSQQLRSAEFITADSESEASISIARPRGRAKNGTTSTGYAERRAKLSASGAHTSQKSKQSRILSTTSKESPSSSIKKNDKLPHPHRNMKNGVGANKKTTSDGGKKRPTSSKAQMKKIKRPKTKGGFLLSDESGDEEHEDGSEDSNSEQAVPPAPRQQVAMCDRGADIEEAGSPPPPLPTKQLNKSRLNMLLGRNKNAQSPLLKNAQSDPTVATTISYQAPTNKRENDQTGQDSKLTPVNSNARRTNAASGRENHANNTVPNRRQRQMLHSLGPTSSNSPYQGTGKVLEGASNSRGSGIMNRPPSRVDNSEHLRSQPRTLEPTATSIGCEKASNAAEGNTHRIPIGAANSRSTPNIAKDTGFVPLSNPQAQGSRPNQLQGVKRLTTVTPLRSLQDTTGQQSRIGRQTHSSTAEIPLAQQSVQKPPGQPLARQPATPAQSSNTMTAPNSLPRTADPSRPQNRNPNPGSTKGQPVADRAPKAGVVQGTQMAQKRKVESISGGPDKPAAPVKKPVVALKPSSMSAPPTTSKGKRSSETGTRLSNSPKVVPSPCAILTPHLQPRLLFTRGNSHNLPATVSPATTPASKITKTVNMSLTTHASADITSLNHSQDLCVSKRSSMKAAATELSITSNKSPVSHTLSPTSSQGVQKISNGTRRGSVKDFFAPVSSSKQPVASSNQLVSRALTNPPQAGVPSGMKVIANPPKGLGKSVPKLSHNPLITPASSTAILEGQDVETAPTVPPATCESVSKSIPTAVLYPSFSPTATAQPERAPVVTLNRPATDSLAIPTQAEGDTQQTSQVNKTIETAISNGCKHENATKPPAKEATEALPPSRVSLTTVATQTDALISHGHDVASRKPSGTDVSVCSSTTFQNMSNSRNCLTSSEASGQPEPYFEYYVFQKIWSGEEGEDAVTATEIAAQPFTETDQANSLAEQLFESMGKQFLQLLRVVFSEQSMKRDKYDCLTVFGAFSPYDYSDQTCYVKIWVERNSVSKYANLDRQALKLKPFVRKEAYILRLFEVVSAPDVSDVESDGQAKLTTRSYHKVPCNEVYTTLDAANRAARSLQIELAHVKDPKDDITTKWQQQNLADLNAKVHALDPSMGGQEGCWRSEFNACGKGGDRLELVVEKVGVFGPRN